jgi:hypothetical protein
MRDQENVAEQPLVRADGVVRSAKSLGLKSFAELTTPSAALRRLRAFFIGAAATPPFSRRGMCPH